MLIKSLRAQHEVEPRGTKYIFTCDKSMSVSIIEVKDCRGKEEPQH